MLVLSIQGYTQCTPSTPLTSYSISINPVCPGENTVITVTGGVDGTGSNIRWYTGPNGTGFNFFTGPGPITITHSNPVTNYYVRREGDCNTTVDLIVSIYGDTEIPNLACKNLETSRGPGGNITISPWDVIASATDNCRVDSFSANVFPNNFSADGVFNVVVSISDISGNVASCSTQVNIVPVDRDGDGIADDDDNCPDLANADQANFDGDFYGDACDPDDDNDGVADEDDAFPFDQTESRDNDGDGIGDNADTDDDNDGQSDVDEAACGSDPKDASSYSPDNEGDGIPDCVDPDDDNDGTNDEIDNCPIAANADQADSGCDEVGDVCDICPGGDDSVDANLDGIPDCSQLLPYADYSASWRRWRRRILICKRGRTLRVSNRSLPAHIRRGALVGPCSSCRPHRRHRSYKIADEELDLLLYPNPVSDQAIISFTAPQSAHVSIQILDARGVLIKSLLDEEVQEGEHQLKFKTQDLAQGMYFYQLRIHGNVLSRPFIVRR